MRHHFEKPGMYVAMFGKVYICNHPVYDRCTLFEMDGLGLAVIQQRYNPETKATYWTEIDPWLNDSLYLHEGFKDYFNKRAGRSQDGLYPTVTIRQIMWALRMKPLKKERWETVFDRKSI